MAIPLFKNPESQLKMFERGTSNSFSRENYIKQVGIKSNGEKVYNWSNSDYTSKSSGSLGKAFNWFAGITTASYVADGVIDASVEAMDYFRPGIKQALFNPSEKTDPNSPNYDPDYSPSPIPNPFSPAEFSFNDNNSPALLAGLMNGSEMVAQSIASLCQITMDDNLRRDQVLASGIQIFQDLIAPLVVATVSIAQSLEGIVENLNTFATAESINALVEPLGAVVGAVANIPQTTLETTNTSTAQPDLSHLNEWASLAKQNEQFKQQTQAFYDSDGAKIAEMSPQQLRAQKDAQLQKNLNDHNTVKFEDDDFSPPMWTGNLFMPFSGREITFDISKPIGSNPFLPTGA